MVTEHLPSTRISLPVLALITAVASAAAPARAQDPSPVLEPPPEVAPVPEQRVYIVAVPMSDDLEAVAARVGAAARASLRRIEGVQWEGPDQAYLGYTDFMLERLNRGRERLEAGRQAYLNLELEQAIELLGGAVDDFESAAAALEDPHDLGEALLFLGASQVFAGHTRGARQTFQRLHVQMPHIAPDPNMFNPDVVQRYEQSAPRGSASGSVTIESEPAGAVAYVDFVPRGRTPLTVEELGDGVHTVRVTRPGATPFVQQVELRRGGSEQVTAFLEDTEATAGLADAVQNLGTADIGSMQPGGPIAEIALSLELDKVGVIRVSEGETDGQARLELLVFDVSDGSRVLRMHGPVPTAMGQLEEAVQRLVTGGLDAALRPRDDGASTVTVDGEQIPAFVQGGEAEQEDEGGAALYEQWWLWAGVGAVVALGVVLTAVLVSGGDDELGENRGGQVVLEF